MRSSSLSSQSQSHEGELEAESSNDSSEHLEELQHPWPAPCSYPRPSDFGSITAHQPHALNVRPQVSPGLPTAYDHNERFKLRERIETSPPTLPKAMKFDSAEHVWPSPVALRTYQSPLLLGRRLLVQVPRPASFGDDAGFCRERDSVATCNAANITNVVSDKEQRGGSRWDEPVTHPETIPHKLQVVRDTMPMTGDDVLASSELRPEILQRTHRDTTFSVATDTQSDVQTPVSSTVETASTLAIRTRGAEAPSKPSCPKIVRPVPVKNDTVPILRLPEPHFGQDTGYLDPLNGCEAMFAPRPRLRCHSLGCTSLGEAAVPERFWSTALTDIDIKTPRVDANNSAARHALSLTGGVALPLEDSTSVLSQDNGIEFVLESGDLLEQERQKWRREHLESLGANSALAQTLRRRARSHNALAPPCPAEELAVQCSPKSVLRDSVLALTCKNTLLSPGLAPGGRELRPVRSSPDLCADVTRSTRCSETHNTFCVPSDRSAKCNVHPSNAPHPAGSKVINTKQHNRGSLIERNIVTDEPFIIGRCDQDHMDNNAAYRRSGQDLMTERVFSLSLPELSHARMACLQRDKPKINVVQSSNSLSVEDLHHERVSVAEASAFLQPPTSLKRLVGNQNSKSPVHRRALSPLPLSPRSSFHSSDNRLAKSVASPVSATSSSETPQSPEIWHANTRTPDSLFFRPLAELYR